MDNAPSPNRQQDPRILISRRAPGLEEPSEAIRSSSGTSRACPVGQGANPGISRWEDESYSRWAKMWFKYSACPAGSEGKISWHRSQAGAASQPGPGPSVPSSSAQPGVQDVCEEKRDLGQRDPQERPGAAPQNLTPPFCAQTGLGWSLGELEPPLAPSSINSTGQSHVHVAPEPPQRFRDKPGGKLALSSKLEPICHLSLCHCPLGAERAQTDTAPLPPSP